MKFGKEFRTHLAETLPEWRDKFLCYKLLKKLLKRYPSGTPYPSSSSFSVKVVKDTDHYNQSQPPLQLHGDTDDVPCPSRTRDPPGDRNVSMLEFQEWFVRLLNDELEKFNDFYVEKEEEFVIRFQELKERIIQMREMNRDRVLSSDDVEFSKEMMDIRRDFVTIHGEMVLLKNYSSLNFAGLVKILKKYDKRTGGLLQLPFTQLALQQPFFTTEPLTRLVRECEANLELLFPLEEEVTESTSAVLPPLPGNQQPSAQSGCHPPLNDITNIPSKAITTTDVSPIGEVIVDVYRSTISAIRTIQGLRTSSTYNPLSFAALFGNQEEEGTGAVTAENSTQQEHDHEHDDDDDVVVEERVDGEDADSAS